MANLFRSPSLNQTRLKPVKPKRVTPNESPLQGLGIKRPRDLKGSIPDAPQILLRNVYGWFIRQERGLYALSEQGRAALGRWPPDDTNTAWDGRREAEPLQRDLVQAPG